MYHLIVVAYPESAAVVMVGKETEDVDAAEVYRDYVFYPGLKQAIIKALGAFKVDDACFYGPRGYIDKLADEMKEICGDIDITTEMAGA